jgi:hypothetical protein
MQHCGSDAYRCRKCPVNLKPQTAVNATATCTLSPVRTTFFTALTRIKYKKKYEKAQHEVYVEIKLSNTRQRKKKRREKKEATKYRPPNEAPRPAN